MQAKIIQIVRTNTTSEHATDPERTGQVRKYVARISLTDMPSLSTSRYYRWVPTSVTVTETLITGYGDDTPHHYRVVSARGFMLKKDGTVGKIAADDNWRIYATREDPMPAELREALLQVVPAFDKGILP